MAEQDTEKTKEPGVAQPAPHGDEEKAGKEYTQGEQSTTYTRTFAAAKTFLRNLVNAGKG
uniref:Uncharacterized protein n=1 Tax=Candidatus Kentrum sp. FM TaxID=2126340 RepID=A0A450RV14_9GAMM|nr:MAG: hypothetical protein BECKFM1743A_GA0114220_1000329 [Candidatus Kentron sp. FM]VFJ43694.1 MAG: hypothetical protein BECKFM1743C_GA0114222_1000329 [Candidatus Kentron sp. FM]VFK05685.1 MAG: hypothetical protein BECKFM1743B_GA0114221_1000329 [Candidatus Kentron sp. FM]